MPVIFRKIIKDGRPEAAYSSAGNTLPADAAFRGDSGSGSGILLLWSIDENEEELRALVTAGDIASAGRFAAESRRREHLAWRAALRTVISDEEVEYDQTGAPRIGSDGNRICISAAHTRGMAAVLVAGNRCAVDIEHGGRDFSKSVPRFISPAESSLPDAAAPDFAAAVWCAKEALYKYSGGCGLDLLKDIGIVRSSLADGMMEGRVGAKSGICVRLLQHGDYIAAYII